MKALEFVLQRYSDDGDSTLGLLFERTADGLVLQGYTLEDEHRDVKVPKETRIPAGLYELGLRRYLTPRTTKYRELFPSWFEWHVEVLDVPNFTDVYIHIGNTDKDTDGCILIADQATNNRVREGRILESTAAYERWYKRVHPYLKAGGRAFLEVRNEHFLRAGR